MSIDLQALLPGVIDIAFTQFSSIQEDLLFSREVRGDYDPVTGKVSEDREEQTLKGIFSELETLDARFSYPEFHEEDGFQVDDKKILIKGADLIIPLDSSLAVTRLRDNTMWNIVGIASDPTFSLYTIRVRGSA